VNRLTLLLLLVFVACARAPSGSAPVAAHLAFTHVHVVDVESGRVLSDHTVLIAGNRIQAVGPSTHVRVPAGAQVPDARGSYLIPGLIDTHVHLAGWWQTSHPDTLALLGWYVANGITSLRDASSAGLEEKFLALRAAAERGEILSPRLYISAPASHRNMRRYGASDLREVTQRLIAMGADGIKLLYLSEAEARDVIEEATRAGVPVYGHTAHWGEDDVDIYPLEAVRAGASGVMHVNSIYPRNSPHAALPSMPRTNAEGRKAWTLYYVTGWLQPEEEVIGTLIETMVARGAWLEPTLVTDRWLLDPEAYDSNPAARYHPAYAIVRQNAPKYEGAEREAYWASVKRMDDFVRRFHEAGGMVLAGSDNQPFPAFGLHEELRLLSEAGLGPAGALRAATINAARALRWQERIGTIEEGKLADLVLLEANPLNDVANTRKISAVVLNGRYLDLKALDRLVAPAEAAARR
jgi:imidazolonepropionase-like amidohydrolase